MAKQKQFRRGTSAEHNFFTGAVGEVTVDTTLDSLRVHDGSQVGGHLLAKQEDLEALQYAANFGYPPYDTVAEGLAATSDGETFSVPGVDEISLYINNAGTEELVGSIPLSGSFLTEAEVAGKFSRTFETVSDMADNEDLVVGQFVKTRGYFSAGDGGGNTYEIVAASTDTDDGGSYIDLPGSGFQAKGLFSTTVKARQFGAPFSGDASAEIQAASDYAAVLKGLSDSAVDLVLEGHFELANPVTLGGAAKINIDTTRAEIAVIAGGDLEANPNQAAITINTQQADVNINAIQCNHICGGILLDGTAGCKIWPGRIEQIAYRGLDTINNCSGMSIFHPRGFEWGPSEPEHDDSGSYVAVGLYCGATDFRVIGGGFGWIGAAVEFAAESSGVELVNHHPFNGNANDTQRLHPFNVVNKANGKNFLIDCYIDNGYIDDQTGTLVIDGGWHLNLSGRVTLTHPYTRIRNFGTPQKGQIRGFESSIGFYTGTWVNDASNLVTNLAATPANMYGDGQFAGYQTKETRLIPAGSPATSTLIAKQGNAATIIDEQHNPGEGTAVHTYYSNGVVTFIAGATGNGEVRVSDTTRTGIVGSGGDTLQLYANGTEAWRIQNNYHFRPGIDNAYSVGTGTNRISQLFAGTTTISTSDEREKEQISAIQDAALDAWGNVQWRSFKYSNAVSEKGDDARTHTGVVAQEVKAAFEAEGLDPFEWGVLCYDEWEAQDEITETQIHITVPAEYDEDGNQTKEAEFEEVAVVVQEAREAGSRYGIRYDEAEALEAAWQRRKIAQLEARLDSLST